MAGADMVMCEFCTSGDGVEAQDMGEGRVMQLCVNCRVNIAENEERAYEFNRKRAAAMVRYTTDIHADVPENAETVAARINEVHQAILIVEQCGAHPLLTDAVIRLGARMNELRRIAPQYIHYDKLG